MAKTNAEIGIQAIAWKRKNNSPQNVRNFLNKSDKQVNILGAWYGN